MCGRYYIEISDAELNEIMEEIKRHQAHQPDDGQLSFKLEGDVYPTDIVPVMTRPSEFSLMRWGFSGFRSSGGDKAVKPIKPIINARSETIMEKPTFRQSVTERRCLIPASGYYEWAGKGTAKTKYRLYLPNRMMFLAGCYRIEHDSIPSQNIPCFVVLTREAAPAITDIHDRMPVIFDRNIGEMWLDDGIDIIGQSLTRLDYAVAQQ